MQFCTRVLNGFITFSETGAFLWKHLDGKRSAADLVELLACEYEMKPVQVLSDVMEFLQNAIDKGIIILC